MRTVEWLSARINLGLDVYKRGRIDSKHVEELCEVLLDYKKIMQAYKVESYKVCATSAFRESRNMLIMRDYVEKQTGLHIDVLSNSEQRFVDYKSIASVTTEFESIIQNAAAIVDIGGSSMQISLFDKAKLITTQNFRIGSVTTREKLAPLTKNSEHFEKMVMEILNHELAGFGKLYQKDRQIKNLIVVGGNLLSLMGGYQNEKQDIMSVNHKQFLDVYDQVVPLSQEEISEKYNISYDQTGVIVPSAIFCRCLMENLGAETLWLPTYSLCDGLAYDYGVKNKYITNCHNFEEDIIAAARSIAKRYKCNQAHIRNLEEIALATSGAVGSDLANMINEAAITAVKHGRQVVSQKDLFEAVEVVLVGKEKKDRIMSAEERRIVSYHEVGHALVTALQKNTEPVQKITIVPRTMGALGYVMQTPEEEKFLNTKKELEIGRASCRERV